MLNHYIKSFETAKLDIHKSLFLSVLIRASEETRSKYLKKTKFKLAKEVYKEHLESKKKTA